MRTKPVLSKEKMSEKTPQLSRWNALWEFARNNRTYEMKMVRRIERPKTSETLRRTSRQVSRQGVWWVLSMFRVEKDTTRCATQVCLRRVESGLGGHDDGVCGVDEELGNTSLSSRKLGGMVRSDGPAFSGFTGASNESCSEKQNHKKRYGWQRYALYKVTLFSNHLSCKR